MIERLTPPASDADLTALAQLLVDAVESGAAVSFLAPLTLERAREWWRGTLSSAHARTIFLVALESDGRSARQVFVERRHRLHPSFQPESRQIPSDGVCELGALTDDRQECTLPDVHERGLLQEPGVDAVEHQLRANHRSGDTRRRFGSRRLGETR
jgi:hypothetical protein